MKELETRDKIKALFFIDKVEDLEKELGDMELEKEGYFTWGDFLELLFRHKRKNKKFTSPNKNKTPREAPDAYTSDPEMKAKIFFSKRKSEKKKTKTPKAKHAFSYRSEIKEIGHNENKLEKFKITGQDYNKFYKATRKNGYTDEFDGHFTVPKPFKFAQREKQKKISKSIRQQKLEEVIDQKKFEEECLIHHQFRANPIPTSTLLPKYEMIKAAEEARRIEVKQSSVEATKMREKPFSFYERDKDLLIKKEKAALESIPEEMKNVKPFKATPIPWCVSTPVFPQIQERGEKVRQERIKKRAQKELEKAKLPPRMEMHEQKKKQGGAQRMLPQASQYSFHPEKSRPIPDFKKQQFIFQRTLEKHKKEKQATVAEPFEFRETKVISL